MLPTSYSQFASLNLALMADSSSHIFSLKVFWNFYLPILLSPGKILLEFFSIPHSIQITTNIVLSCAYFNQLVDELLVHMSLKFVFLYGSQWWNDIQHIFVFSHYGFCITSESSSWVEIPIWQAYQLLNKYYCYIFLGSVHHPKCFPKDFDLARSWKSSTLFQ